MKWYFIVDGDPQVGLETENNLPIVRKCKQNMGERLKQHESTNGIKMDFVICSGDLTEHGFDAKRILFYQNGEHNELEVFKRDYYRNIQKCGIDVYCCAGNHDTYVKWPYVWKPVFKFLQEQYGATYGLFKDFNTMGLYRFLHQGVVFLCMGIYPKDIEWLKDNLPQNKESPVIIFYHYNTIKSEPYSDWWSDKEKDIFYSTIKNHNVLLIINGHLHGSKEDVWNGIKILRGSGDKVGLVEMEDETLIDITLI